MKKVEVLETTSIVASEGSIVSCSDKQADLLIAQGKAKEVKEQKKKKEKE